MSQQSRENMPSLSVALTDALGTTPAIRFTELAGGMIYLATNRTLTFYASDAETGTYQPLYRHFPNQATAVAGAFLVGANPFPVECFGAAFLKIVSSAAETVLISRKS